MRKVIVRLLCWQQDRTKTQRAKACLGAVRQALLFKGWKLPHRSAPVLTALECEAILSRDPEYWGWERIHSPLTEPCLVFFKSCGKLADGRVAGHVAIYDPVSKMHYANENYRMNSWWAGRIVAAYRRKTPLDVV